MDSGEKVFVFEDVAKNKERNNCWLLISGKVYDVTQFLEDHPGGDEVLLAASGKDATQDFEDVGHSDDARNTMKKYYIGEVDSATVPAPKKIRTEPYSVTQKDNESGFLSKILPILVPLLILGFAFGLQFLGGKGKAEA
ncbi:ARABIDOPSIS CYTOCHROME B5 ISOFORM E, cytochrome B5 isoform E [Hibiscus trionum]|uniref:ARABIDOPSIS CYTOCHROME B5 ISOFORM E, cytochrome B5 isoform E n=1 Tax=Hibiscus trionum TaxID=183268 RepID=A0A9W7HAF0_HIBTR|nr:ARABIDOPSIS CYTOCHROME B5 ISOFORM E, cytochrome B5 isoform E [Hibiscus trionum]